MRNSMYAAAAVAAAREGVERGRLIVVRHHSGLTRYAAPTTVPQDGLDGARIQTDVRADQTDSQAIDRLSSHRWSRESLRVGELVVGNGWRV